MPNNPGQYEDPSGCHLCHAAWRVKTGQVEMLTVGSFGLILAFLANHLDL